MGVMGSYCAACALPVQQDHYVPMISPPGMLFISKPSNPPPPGEELQVPPFPFGPEHAWLLEAVALEDGKVVARGPVDNGALGKLFVGDGNEGYLLLHAACFERGATDARGTHPCAQVAAYQGQLFEVLNFATDGKADLLAAPPPVASPPPAEMRTRPTTVAGLLDVDRDWESFTLGADRVRTGIVRFRAGVRPDTDVSGYPELLWLIQEFDSEKGFPDAPTLKALESLETQIKRAVEADKSGILVAVTLGNGQAQYVLYTRDRATTRAAIEALPRAPNLTKPLEFDEQHDPRWRVFLEELNPSRL